MSEGILIVIDGIDGAGKTTQIERLGRALELSGETVVLSKEPTDGKWGRMVRDSAKTGRLSLTEELEAFVKDRQEHVQALVNPALASGAIVLLDRYFYSTIAYQGARGGDVIAIEREMRGFAPIPDATFFIDAEPSVTLRRIDNSRTDGPNHFERLEPLQEIRRIFLDIATNGSEITIVNGMADIETVSATIVSLLLEGVLKKKRCFKSYDCDAMFCSAREAGVCRWAEIYAKLRSGEKPLAVIQKRR